MEARQYALALAAQEAMRDALEVERRAGISEASYLTHPRLQCLKRPRTPEEGLKQRRVGMLSEPSSLLQRNTSAQAEARQSMVVLDTQMVEALDSNPLFSSLPPDQKKQVYSTLSPRQCSDGEVLVHEGEMGSTMFVVDSGTYAMTISSCGEQPVRTFMRGEFFGELALMFNTPRSSSITCSEAGQLWELDRLTFRRILLGANRALLDTKLRFLKSVPLFTTLTDEEMSDVAAALEEEEYDTGQLVVSEGATADSMYIIKVGSQDSVVSAHVQRACVRGIRGIRGHFNNPPAGWGALCEQRQAPSS